METQHLKLDPKHSQLQRWPSMLAMKQSHLLRNGLKLEKNLKLARRHSQLQRRPWKPEKKHALLKRNGL
jgi:hypothetical protein